MLDELIKVSISLTYVHILANSLHCYTLISVWHFDKEECTKYPRTKLFGGGGVKGKLVAYCRWGWAHPAWCEPWARHADRWGGVELKVSSWVPDWITTMRGTRATEDVCRFSLLTSLSLSRHQSLCKFAPDEWEVRRQWPFWLRGNLSQVSSLFGTAGMCDEADFYESFSPDFTLFKASLPI